MRALLVALLVLGGLGGLAAADPPAKGWPAAGLCIAPWPSKTACIPVSPADARAIQRSIIAHAGKRKDYAAARRLAQPITESSIGQFVLRGYEFVDFTGDVLQAVAVESHRGGMERGFRVTLGRNKGGWAVLYFEHYVHPDPQIDR